MTTVPEVDVQIEYGQVDVCSSIPVSQKLGLQAPLSTLFLLFFMATIDIYDVIETGYF